MNPIRFDILDTPLPGLKLVQRKRLGDTRGYLERLFCHQELQPWLAGKSISQINHTYTMKLGTVRGLHFQFPPYAEIKIVSCLRGQILDVAVDLRPGSPTFLHWHAENLSEENHRSLLIPEGFAHGFQTLTDDCEMLYFHTAQYEPSAEGGVNAYDMTLGIKWPLPLTERSTRDAVLPMLDENFQGIDV